MKKFLTHPTARSLASFAGQHKLAFFVSILAVSLVSAMVILSPKPGYSVTSETIPIEEIQKYVTLENPEQGISGEEFRAYISALKKEQINNYGLEKYTEEVKSKISEATYNDTFTQAFITPAGGTLAAGGIKVTFPQGAVDQDLIVSFKSGKTTIVNENSLLGKVYDLKAETIFGEEVTQFDKNLTISTSLSDSDLKVSNWQDAATYYFNEETKEWEKIQSRISGKQVIAMTNHFSLYSTSISQPDGFEEDEYAFADCGLAVDDSYAAEPEEGGTDRTMCFESSGTWTPQESGALQTSLYSNQYNAIAYWTPDFESLNGPTEVFVTIPTIRLGDSTGEVTGDLATEEAELSTKIRYLLLTGEGIERIDMDVNQFEEEGTLYSLDTYDFNGTDAQLSLWGLYSEDAGDKYVVADAACFGECPAGMGDVTPPLIEDVKVTPLLGLFKVEAKVTDEGSGVGNVYLSINGNIYLMTGNGSDIYAVNLPYNPGKDVEYFIIAYDNSGNQSIWSPLRGYVTRGPGLGIGIPPESKDFLHYKTSTNNSITAAVPGIDRCSPCAGDPINTTNGNLMEQNTLINLPGRPEIDLKITYNSLGGALGIFGESWIHSYSYKLIEMDNAFFQGAMVTYPTGHTAEFTGSNLTAPAGNNDKLVKVGEQYQLAHKDLTVITFDENGDPIRIEDNNGNGVTLEYGFQDPFINLSQLTKVTADGGRSISLSYDDLGRAIQIQAPEGKVIDLTYDDLDNLISYTDGNGGIYAFTYENNAITSKTSPKGHSIYVNTYDDRRRVTKQVAGESFMQEYIYSEGQTKVVDANGNTGIYTFDDGMMTSSTNEIGGKTTFIYNDQKRLIAEVDPLGNRTEYEYDDNGNMVLIRDAKGQIIEREFNEFNKPTKEINRASDHITTWEYDDKGNMIKSANALGNSIQMTYNDFGQLIEAKDAKGFKTKFIYNTWGDLIKVIDAEGGQVVSNFDELGRMVSMINANGVSSSFEYDLNGNLLGLSSALGYKLQYEYDANNHVIKFTDANGNITSYEYDSSENLTKIIDALGGVTSSSYDAMNKKVAHTDPLGRVTTFAYSPNYKLIKSVMAAGTADQATVILNYNKMGVQTGVIDPEGRKGIYEFDPLFQLQEMVADSGAKNASSQLSYSLTGKVTRQVDANGNATEFKYDAVDQLIEMVDAKGHKTKYEYDANGNITSQTDPKGNVTTFAYDRLNRLIKSTDPKGEVSTLSYDNLGNVVSTTNANKVTTLFEYDELNRLTRKIEGYVDPIELALVRSQVAGADALFEGTMYDPSLDGIGTNVITTYEYDLNGNILKATNPRSYSTSFSYNALNRVSEITDAKGNSTVFVYDAVGNRVSMTDRNGNTTAYSYDNLNRLKSTVNAEGHKYQFKYDKVGNVVAVVDPKGNTTYSTYNGLDQLVKVTDALGGVTRYNYDLVGNLLKFTDANTHSSTYEYDSVYNLVASKNPEGHGNTFSYDANRNLIRQTDANSNSTKFGYDVLNRTTQVTDAKGGITHFEYDKVGNIVSRTDANGHINNFKYEPLNRLFKAVDAAGFATRFEYDANGNQTVLTDANGNSTTLSYDELDRLIKRVNAESETVAFEYDNEGNQIRKIDPDGVATAYWYDDIYRLTGVNLNDVAGGGEDHQTNVATRYTYDANGNLTKITEPKGNVTSFGYDALNRQVKEVNPLGNIWKYSYDAVGNKVARVDAKGKATTYAYYPDNQLKSAHYFDGTSVSFAYDPNNNKVSMNDALGNSNWAYDQLNRVSSEVDSLGRSKSYEYDAVGNVLALVYPDGRKVDYDYTANDWLASVTDPEGLITKISRDKVGNATKVVNPNNTVSTIDYDRVYRELSIRNVEIGGKVNSSFEYAYDQVGQRTQVAQYYAWRQPGDVVESYEYDPIRRLTASSTSQGLYSNYSYDRNSNRVAWVSNDEARTPRPFDKHDLLYDYNSANQLIRVRERQIDGVEPTPGNKPTRENTNTQTPKTQKKTERKPIPKVSKEFVDTFRNFINHLEAQDQKQITTKAYTELTKQVEHMQELAEDGLLIRSEANKLIKKLEKTINDFTASKDIKSGGIANALITKLKEVKDAVNSLPTVLDTQIIIVEVPIVPDVNTDTISDPLNTEDDPYKKVEFRYDSNGNRVRMEEYGPVGPEYQLTKYTYDPENRIASITNYDSSQNQKWTTRDITTNNYDGLGRRLVKTYDPKSDSKIQDVGAGRKRTEYVFDYLDPIAEYTIHNDHYQNLYRTRRAGGFNQQSRILSTQKFTPDSEKDKDYFHFDALGSVVGITNSDGGGHKNYRYYEFGQLEGATGQRSTHSTKDGTDPQNHYTFTGQEYDENTELYEFYSRSYDPINAVWNRADEYRGNLSDPMSLHRYMYVNQGATNEWDVDGFYGESVTIDAYGNFNLTYTGPGATTLPMYDPQSYSMLTFDGSTVGLAQPEPKKDGWFYLGQGLKIVGGVIEVGGGIVGAAGCSVGTGFFGTAACVCGGGAVATNGALHIGEGFHGIINGENKNVKGEIIYNATGSHELAGFGSFALDLTSGFGAASSLSKISSVNSFMTSTPGYYTSIGLGGTSFGVGGITTISTLDKCSKMSCDYNDYYNLGAGLSGVGFGGYGMYYGYNGLYSPKSTNPLTNTTYTDKVLQQMTLDDYHSFPKIVDNYGDLGTTTPLTGGDGVTRTLLEILGGYGGKEGVFQYIIEPNNTINHRLFVPK